MGLSGYPALGDRSDSFHKNIVATLIDLTCVSWGVVRTSSVVRPGDDEVVIAGHLVREMIKEKTRRGLPLRIEEEVGTRSAGATKPDGRIDIKALYNFCEADYFGIECKRVAGQNSSLKSQYVLEGVMRFVDGKYAIGHCAGSIAGFVIQGTPSDAADGVGRLINRRRTKVELTRTFLPVPILGKGRAVYCSQHRQRGTSSLIDLYHMFLPVAAAIPNAATMSRRRPVRARKRKRRPPIA